MEMKKKKANTNLHIDSYAAWHFVPLPQQSFFVDWTSSQASAPLC
jgi:hypothetical protein